MKRTPIAIMIDSVCRCVKCNAPMGKCDCWMQCKCGWFFEKGGQCRNPIHKKQRHEMVDELEIHKILIRNLSTEELERRAKKAMRIKSNMWTQEEFDLAERKAEEIMKIFKPTEAK